MTIESHGYQHAGQWRGVAPSIMSSVKHAVKDFPEDDVTTGHRVTNQNLQPPEIPNKSNH